MSTEKDKAAGEIAKAAPKQGAPARKPDVKKGDAPAERRTFAEFMTEYFRSLKYEWLKLTFPTRKELVQSTIVVLMFTVVLMTVISLYDLLMSIIFREFILR